MPGLLWPFARVNPTQKAYPYFVVIPAIGTAVPLNLVKQQLRLNTVTNFNTALNGTFDVENGNNLVVGIGSICTQQICVGQQIQIAGVTYTVLSVNSDSSFRITINYAGISASGLTINADSEDIYLLQIIYSVMQYCESFTGRDLLTKTYLTYRDCLDFVSTALRRSALINFISVEYLSSIEPDVWSLVDPSIYYVDKQNDYSALYLQVNQQWPSNQFVYEYQGARMMFTAGYGPDYTYVPYDLRLGMLNHICQIYSNRGDCSECSTGIPAQTLRAYKSYKIINITGQDYSARF